MVAITSTGIGSGLDIEGLVSQLVAAEGDPAKKRLDLKEASFQARLTAYGVLKGALADLQSAVGPLTTLEGQAVEAQVGNGDLLSATATSIATPGRHTVEVEQLAQAQRLASKGFGALSDVVGGGTLTFEFGTYDASTNTFTPNPERPSQQVDIAAGSTLEGIREAIQAADIGVEASIVDDGSGLRLVLTSSETGQAQGLRITVVDDDGNALDDSGLSQLAYDPEGTRRLTEIEPPLDALLKVDGLDITRPSNTVTGVIPGVTLELRQAAPGQPTFLDVVQSSEGVSAAVEDLVTALNAFRESLGSLTSYDPTTQQGGVLLGDQLARSAAFRIKGIVGERFPEAGRFTTLAEIGVGFERDGSFSLDASRLEAALDEDPQGVMALLGAAGKRMDDVLSSYLGGSGFIEAATQGIDERLADIQSQREALNERLARLEQRYRAQFTALDGLIAQLRSTSDFLSRQLEALPKPGKVR